MERVIVTRQMIGICYMQVCAIKDATDEEILSVCNAENPAGTTNGWAEVARGRYKDKSLRPVTCEENPNRKHFIVIC